MSNRVGALCAVVVFFLVSGCANTRPSELSEPWVMQRMTAAAAGFPSSPAAMDKLSEEDKARVQHEAEKKKKSAKPAAKEEVGKESGPANPDGKGWWYIRFVFNWSGAVDEAEAEPNCNCQDKAAAGKETAEKEVAKGLGKDKDGAREAGPKVALKVAPKVAKEVKKDNQGAEDEPPAWYLDILVADRIAEPALRARGNEIDLWRFHRRAGHDKGGHQFSLIVYSTPATVDKLVADVKANPLVKKLTAKGLLKEVQYPGTSVINRPNIASTSDQEWPDVLQRAWPLYIMGASETWMMLVDQLVAAHPDNKKGLSLAKTVKLYQDVERQMNELWRDQSRHAFFHHLNALFGYEELLVRF